ncbi:MAG: hypothetical protein FWC09_07095 [Lachnospiraceae bacterium]|nr:hypothetical protein [Lachnospiraceae bacterium]
MHIAVCDDNIAERKQTERLLNRESDRRKTDTRVLYIRSYGHEEALLNAPMQYDLFLIDMTNSDINGLDLALKLLETGITAPIILCVSTIDYRKAYTRLANPPRNIFFIDKPLKVLELTEILDRMIELNQNITKTIELRTDAKTFYLNENDIICGVCRVFSTDIYLNDGSVIRVNGNMLNFFSEICTYPAFYLLTKKVFVNTDHINKYSFFKLSLSNGQKFSLSITTSNRLKKHLTL